MANDEEEDNILDHTFNGLNTNDYYDRVLILSNSVENDDYHIRRGVKSSITIPAYLFSDIGVVETGVGFPDGAVALTGSLDENRVHIKENNALELFRSGHRFIANPLYVMLEDATAGFAEARINAEFQFVQGTWLQLVDEWTRLFSYQSTELFKYTMNAGLYAFTYDKLSGKMSMPNNLRLEYLDQDVLQLLRGKTITREQSDNIVTNFVDVAHILGITN